MKKILSMLLICIMLLSLFSCGTKYAPQASTEEEMRVVMTLNFDNKSYDIKYELYRAFFLAYKESAEADAPDILEGGDAAEYIDNINKKIVSAACEIYSAFHLCDKIGVNVFSSSYDDEIEYFIDESVKSIIISVKYEDERDITEEEAYSIYLSRLKDSYLTYEVQMLLYRYELALDEIEKYYLGTYDPEDPSSYNDKGKLEYTESDVRSYYNGEDSVRVIEAFISKDASNSAERIEILREKMAEKASAGRIDEMITIIAGESMAVGSEIENGLMIGRYQLNGIFYKEYTDAAFELAVGEVSDVLEISDDNGLGYYVIYKCDKNSEHLEENYSDIEFSYRKNAVEKIREQIRVTLADSAAVTEIYNTISHADIKM